MEGEREYIEPPLEDPESRLLPDKPTHRFFWGLAVAPLLLRDDGRLPLRASMRKHRLLVMGLVVVIVVIVIALVTTGFTNKRGDGISAGAGAEAGGSNVDTSLDDNMTIQDLVKICSEGAARFGADKVPEDVARRQSDFAAMVEAAGVTADLAPLSCSAENLAVLYLAANPPKYLNQKILMVRYTLTTFYISLAGWKWSHVDNWLVEEDECTWLGIECSDSGVLTGLSLRHNNLGGTLPEALNYFSSLHVLNVAQNSITGTLPSAITKLTNLIQLDASLNEFSGSVPEGLWKLSHLKSIDLTHFGGTLTTIPSEIGSFSNLELFSAPQTNAEGTLPSELGLCLSLRFLNLSRNNLKSSIPTEVGSLAVLQTLYLSGNSIDSVPEQLCALLEAGTLLSFDMKEMCVVTNSSVRLRHV